MSDILFRDVMVRKPSEATFEGAFYQQYACGQMDLEPLTKLIAKTPGAPGNSQHKHAMPGAVGL